jgi:AraC-like DNA-binding protein
MNNDFLTEEFTAQGFEQISIGDQLNQFDLQSFLGRLKFLYHQAVHPEKTLERQCALFLSAGCQMFGAQKAFIVSSLGAIFHSIYEFDADSGEISSELNAVEEYCYRTIIDRDETHGVSISLPQQLIENNEKRGSMPYNGRTVRQYLGAPLLVSGNKCGVLCFLITSKSEPSHLDTETLDFMAEGVARMIEINNAQEKNRIEEIRGYATAGVRSLDEYIGYARLPEVYGVSGRVVEVLQRRIGKKPLAIDFIAEELNLSKRTLQRRLQQQNISFAQLRDQVRFHYSIDYLVRQTLSIDGISMALDFSDRTSFTNAFKRWTNLSPSTFRKLFRDYV